MEYGFAKDRLPRGSSYPLTRDQLDASLPAPLAGRVRWVAFSGRRDDAILLARYWGEADERRFAAGTVWLSLYAVPSSEREAVSSSLLADGLPRLVRWLRDAECRGPSWRAVDHRIEFGMRCGRLIAREDGAMAVEEEKYRCHLLGGTGGGYIAG